METMNLPVVYLASPYSHRLAVVRAERYGLVCQKAGELMNRGLVVYSPIAHSHPIDAFMSERKDHDFWMRQCVPMLTRCDSLIVYTLDGWKESRGVSQEIALAIELGKKVSYES